LSENATKEEKQKRKEEKKKRRKFPPLRVHVVPV